MRANAASPASPCYAKFNGAVGNHNAHLSAWPAFDWGVASTAASSSPWGSPSANTPSRSSRTTPAGRAPLRRHRPCQHHADRRLPRHLDVHLARLLQAEASEGEVGSTTMPHKVNPIDFENPRAIRPQATRCSSTSGRKTAGQPHAARPDRLHGPLQHGCGLATVLALDSCLRGLGKSRSSSAWRRTCMTEVLSR